MDSTRTLRAVAVIGAAANVYLIEVCVCLRRERLAAEYGQHALGRPNGTPHPHPSHAAHLLMRLDAMMRDLSLKLEPARRFRST